MSKKITSCHIRTESSQITSTFNVIVRHNSIKYSRKFELFLGFCVNLKLIFKHLTTKQINLITFYILHPTFYKIQAIPSPFRMPPLGSGYPLQSFLWKTILHLIEYFPTTKKDFHYYPYCGFRHRNNVFINCIKPQYGLKMILR